MPVLINKEGTTIEVSDLDARARLDDATGEWRLADVRETLAPAREKVQKDKYGNGVNKSIAFASGILDAGTLGMGSTLLAKGAEATGLNRNATDVLKGSVENNKGWRIAGEVAPEIIAAVATGGLSEGVTLAKGGSAAAKAIGKTAATEAAISAAGAIDNGISNVLLSRDDVTLERIASSISSTVGTAGLIGGLGGALSKASQIGLGKAGRYLDEVVAKRNAAANVADDLAGADLKTLQTLRKTELAVAEDSAKLARKSVADDIMAHKLATDSDGIFQATQKATGEAAQELPQELRVLAKRQLDVKKRLDYLTDNMRDLGDNPKKALDILQRQEDVLTKLDDIRVRSADVSDPLSTTLNDFRKSKLEGVPAALERNRALQTSISNSIGPPSSARLTQIDEAMDVARSGGGQPSALQNIVTGAVYGEAASLVNDSGIPGANLLAPALAGKAASSIGGMLFGKLGKTANAIQGRSIAAAQAFLKGASTAARYLPPVATRVLSKVSYSQDETTPTSRRDLASLYKARTDEIKQQTMYDQTGQPVLRPEARQVIAKRLEPIAISDPIAADRLETIAARRIEYLSSIIPRKPDIMGLQLSGPDKWQPSDMEMRSFARSVAAIEDPVGVFERASSGSVTSEDAKALQAVYPEMLRDWTTQVMTAASQAKKPVPYKNRVALSILTGQPLDPSLAPHILSALQQSFAAEPGTEEGTQAPTPQPQFGSVKADSVSAATPSQERAL